MHSGIKWVLDMLPLAAFFITYKQADIMTATLALIGATLLSLAVTYSVERKVAMTPLATAIIVSLFGGLTVWLDDPMFIKLKPTIVNLLFAVILLGGLWYKKPLLKPLFGSALRLSDHGWHQLTLRWACFFLLLAVLNELVWRNVSEATWVNFKVFGLMGLTLVFALSQIPLMQREMLQDDPS